MLASRTAEVAAFGDLFRQKIEQIVLELMRDPERIGRVDAEALLAHPYTWREPDAVAHLLGRRLSDDYPLCHVWFVTNEAVQLQLLGPRRGLVFAYGSPNHHNQAAYLLMIPGDGLAYHRPLAPGALRAAKKALQAANTTYVTAMQEELAVVTHIVEHIDDYIDDADPVALRQIRRMLQNLGASQLEHVELANSIAVIVARVMAVFYASGFRYEDAVNGTMRTVAQQPASNN